MDVVGHGTLRNLLAIEKIPLDFEARVEGWGGYFTYRKSERLFATTNHTAYIPTIQISLVANLSMHFTLLSSFPQAFYKAVY